LDFDACCLAQKQAPNCNKINLHFSVRFSFRHKIQSKFFTFSLDFMFVLFAFELEAGAVYFKHSDVRSQLSSELGSRIKVFSTEFLWILKADWKSGFIRYI